MLIINMKLKYVCITQGVSQSTKLQYFHADVIGWIDYFLILNLEKDRNQPRNCRETYMSEGLFGQTEGCHDNEHCIFWHFHSW